MNYVSPLLLLFMLFSCKSGKPSATLKSNFEFSTNSATIENLPNKNFECTIESTLINITPCTDTIIMKGFILPVQEDQFITSQDSIDYQIVTFGNKYKDNKELTSTTIVDYQTNKISLDNTFKQDFINLLLDNSFQLKDAGKGQFLNQDAYWIRVNEIDNFEIVKTLMFYLNHPITGNMFTVMINTYSDKNVEEKLCSQLEALEALQFK